jgi:hypothetical protein
VRRFFLFGLVRPARLRMLPKVLAAGQFTSGSSISSRALSLRAPHDGCLLRKAKISFSIASVVAWEHPFGLLLRFRSPSGPTSLYRLIHRYPVCRDTPNSRQRSETDISSFW